MAWGFHSTKKESTKDTLERTTPTMIRIPSKMITFVHRPRHTLTLKYYRKLSISLRITAIFKMYPQPGAGSIFPPKLNIFQAKLHNNCH